MLQKFKEDYISISIPVIKNLEEKLPFDIYIKRSESSYTKVFKKDDYLDASRIDHYWQNKNVEALFVNRESYRTYLSLVEKVAVTLLKKDSSLSVEELISVSNEMIDLTMVEVYVDMNFDSKSLLHASTSVKGCIKALSKNPKTMITLFQHINSHPYLMKHSVATSVFSLLLAKMAGMSSPKTLNSLGVGALLHDIGLSQLSFDIEEKDQLNLTAAEWKELKEHPQLGKRMLDGLKIISDDVSMIVLQHHEQPNGRGYPNGFYDKKIYYPAKIVAIADSFSSLIMKQLNKKAFSPQKAIHSMTLDQGKFDAELLKTFTSLFEHLK